MVQQITFTIMKRKDNSVYLKLAIQLHVCCFGA